MATCRCASPIEQARAARRALCYARPMRNLIRATLVLASAVVLSSALVAAQESVGGKWALDVDSPQGVMKVDLVLNVAGESVKGTIASELGESAFTGTAKDGAVKFTFDMSGPQGPMTITTSATVSGDAIKGEMDYGQGVAPFTGKRAAQ